MKKAYFSIKSYKGKEKAIHKVHLSSSWVTDGKMGAVVMNSNLMAFKKDFYMSLMLAEHIGHLINIF